MNEITLELTNQCNNYCLYCSSNANDEILKELNINYIKNILNKYKPKQVNLSGGEPLLYSEIFTLIKYLKEQNYNVNIYTSGNYENNYDNNYDKLKKLKELNINKVIFNYNINSSILFDYITQSNYSHIKTFDSIIISLQLGIDTEIHIVPMSITLDYLEETIKHLLQNIGIKKINILKLVNQGRCLKNSYLLPKDYSIIYKLKDKYKDNIKLGTPFNTYEKCLAGKEKVVIKCNEEIIPCETYKDGICKCERVDKNVY